MPGGMMPGGMPDMGMGGMPGGMMPGGMPGDMGMGECREARNAWNAREWMGGNAWWNAWRYGVWGECLVGIEMPGGMPGDMGMGRNARMPGMPGNAWWYAWWDAWWNMGDMGMMPGMEECLEIWVWAECLECLVEE